MNFLVLLRTASVWAIHTREINPPKLLFLSTSNCFLKNISPRLVTTDLKNKLSTTTIFFGNLTMHLALYVSPICRIVPLIFLLAIALGFTNVVSARQIVAFKSLADFDQCASKYGYDTGVCLQALEAYAKSHPNELLAIAKRARLQFTHWVALRFFEPALGKSPSAAQCADEDLGLAVISGLSMPADESPNAAALRMLNGPCFTGLRPTIEKEIVSSNGTGYLTQHACPVFIKRGIKLALCDGAKAGAAAASPSAATQPEKLPAIDIATTKFGLLKVFAGPEGERVTMTDLPDSPSAYLIRVDGVRGAINGKTRVHQQEVFGSGDGYWTEFEGKRALTMTARGSSPKNYTLYLPGVADGIKLSYRERESKAATDDMLRK
jgi:hypothetical protein